MKAHIFDSDKQANRIVLGMILGGLISFGIAHIKGGSGPWRVDLHYLYALSLRLCYRSGFSLPCPASVQCGPL